MEPLVRDKPLASGDFCEDASLFALREREASLLLSVSVSFCMREETVSLHVVRTENETSHYIELRVRFVEVDLVLA